MSTRTHAPRVYAPPRACKMTSLPPQHCTKNEHLSSYVARDVCRSTYFGDPAQRLFGPAPSQRRGAEERRDGNDFYRLGGRAARGGGCREPCSGEVRKSPS